MLLVSKQKVKLFNRNLDSAYQIQSNKEIETASWSPYNPHEIFLLTRESKNLTDDDKKLLTSMQYQYPVLDLNLYRLNLDSMTMCGITTFYDYSLPLLKVGSELWGFFSPNRLNIDKRKNLIYFRCLCLFNQEETSDIATYFVNLKSRATYIDSAQTLYQNSSMGDLIRIYSRKSPQNDKFKVKTSGKFIEIVDLTDKKPKIKIPTSLFDKNVLGRFRIEDVDFNLYYTPDNGKIIFSPYFMGDMDVMQGNLYMSDINGNNLKLLIKDWVLGYTATLRHLDNGMNVIESGNELYFYNNNFELIKQYSDYRFYELR